MASQTRLAGASLLLFALLTVAAPFLPSHADLTPTSPPAEVAAFFRNDAVLQSLQAWLHAGPALLLLAAVALIFARMGEGAGGSTLASTALVGSGALAAVTIAAFFGVVGAIRAANEGSDPHVALLLYNAAWTTMAFAPTFLAPFIVVPIGLAARDVGLPGWMRPASLVVGALCALLVLLAAHPATQGAVFAGTMLLILWSIVAGALLLVRGDVTKRVA